MQVQSQFLDMYRSMARRANDSVKTALESTERLHQQQLEAVRAALEQSNIAARQFGDVQSVDELLQAQSRLVGSQVAQFMELWRGMFRAIGDTQMTMWSQMQSHAGQTTELMRQAYDLTRRATEDATRMAASQVTSIAREAQPEQSRPPQRKTA
jgi:hypothetical protein